MRGKPTRGDFTVTITKHYSEEILSKPEKGYFK